MSKMAYTTRKVSELIMILLTVRSVNFCACYDVVPESLLERVRNLQADVKELQHTDADRQKEIEKQKIQINRLQDALEMWDTLANDVDLSLQLKDPHRRLPLNNGLVAFMAKLSNHVTENVTAGQPIIFETVDLNVGDGYNWKTGHFTAPVSGIYLFSLSLLSHNYGNNYYVHGEIVQNSKPIARALAVGDPNDNRDQGAVTVFLDVQKGDIIWIKSIDFDKVTVGGDLFSVFCGYLLWQKE